MLCLWHPFRFLKKVILNYSSVYLIILYKCLLWFSIRKHYIVSLCNNITNVYNPKNTYSYVIIKVHFLLETISYWRERVGLLNSKRFWSLWNRQAPNRILIIVIVAPPRGHARSRLYHRNHQLREQKHCSPIKYSLYVPTNWFYVGMRTYRTDFVASFNFRNS